jgi:hypothetical protein
VGDETRLLWTDPGILSAPAVKLDGFNFTGTTEF